ncbi:polysaccharide ABC superfamily ATP binding cassette transporter, permease domain protein [Corynebacterium simulans]|nr:polysaccharide ABC superfamily ATP binding cassette transporter, permease domain protein [Corynebacterium simulans]
MPLVTQAWFFLSGVMFTLDRFDHAPTVKQIMSHNPAYEFLSAVRNVAIYDTIPSLSEWGSLCAWTFGLFAFGFLFFWQAEDRYVRLT